MPDRLGNEDFFLWFSCRGKTGASSAPRTSLTCWALTPRLCSLETCGSWQNAQQKPGWEEHWRAWAMSSRGMFCDSISRALGHPKHRLFHAFHARIEGNTDLLTKSGSLRFLKKQLLKMITTSSLSDRGWINHLSLKLVIKEMNEFKYLQCNFY